jgi:hypothetical protein
MGTRSTIHVKDGNKTIISIYNQYDGYPTGVGQDLYEALNKGFTEVKNGFHGGDTMPEVFNGLGCLSAYLVTKFKDSVGQCYITNSKDRQEYNYFVSLKDNAVFLKVTDWKNKTIFRNYLTQFNAEKVEGLE